LDEFTIYEEIESENLATHPPIENGKPPPIRRSTGAWFQNKFGFGLN
jgi:hypothetical protein